MMIWVRTLSSFFPLPPLLFFNSRQWVLSQERRYAVRKSEIDFLASFTAEPPPSFCSKTMFQVSRSNYLGNGMLKGWNNNKKIKPEDIQFPAARSEIKRRKRWRARETGVWSPLNAIFFFLASETNIFVNISQKDLCIQSLISWYLSSYY